MANDEPQSGHLVRSFSHDLQQNEPANTITRGLVTKISIDSQREKNLAALRDQWNMFLNEGRDLAVSIVPDEEVYLLNQSRQLYQAWTKFCKTLPDNQQAEICTEVPSIGLLYKYVANASVAWEENRNTTTGRVKKIFTHLCNTLENHSNLVSIFPTDDKYVRLITGSLSAIAQASINHEKIATAVADSLEELGKDMVYWNSLISEYGGDSTIQCFIIELYVVVTEFLTQVFVKWSQSSWRRFIMSFDQNAFQKLFGEKRKRIEAIQQRMKHRADLIHQIQVKKYIRDDTEYRESLRNAQSLTVSQLGSYVQTQALYIEMLYRLGTNVELLLKQLTKTPTEECVELSRILPPPKPQTDLPENKDRIDVKPLTLRPIQEVISPIANQSVDNKDHFSTNLVQYTQQDALRIFEPAAAKFGHDIKNLITNASRSTKIEIDHMVKRRIEAWTMCAKSDTIWIQGPHDVLHPSQNTLTAACLVALSSNNSIPCISYFCSLQVHVADNERSSRREILVDMVKSLIVQLWLMPRNTGTVLEMPNTNFEKLGQSQVDINEALHVLRQMRALVPGDMHCVIEAVQELEDRDDPQHTQDLHRVLTEVINLSQPVIPNTLGPLQHAGTTTGDVEDRVKASPKAVKVCFTSDGYVDILAEMAQYGRLDNIEYIDEADRNMDGETAELSCS